MKHSKGKSNSGKRRSKRQAGFSLIELLVVLVILGMIAIILTIAVSKTLKRQRLRTGAQQLTGFIQKAYVLASQKSAGVFVRILPVKSDGTRDVQLVEDSNGDQSLEVGSDQVLSTEVITGDLVLANSTVSSQSWPTVGNDIVLFCNSDGLAVNPATGTQITGTADITLTHIDMQNGSLSPKIRYDIKVYPIWRPAMSTERY